MFAIYLHVARTSRGYLVGTLNTFHNGKLIFSKLVKPNEEQHWLNFISKMELVHGAKREVKTRINSLDPDITSYDATLYFEG